MAIRLPGPDDIASVGVTRDPGVRASAEDFGAATGRAMDQAGRQLQVVAALADDLAKERQSAEDKVFLDTFDLELARDSNKMLLEKQTQAPLGGEGFAKGVDTDLDQFSQSLPERLMHDRGFRPSKAALQRAQSVATQRRADVLVRAQTWEHNQRIAALGQQFGETIDALEQEAFTSGNAEDSLARLYQSMEAYQGIIPADKLQAGAEEAEQRIVAKTIEGLILAGNTEEAERVTGKYFGARPQAPRGEIDGIVDRIIGVESGGNASAKNPNSSATGLGQFIASTWLATVRKHRPDIAKGKTADQILALRKDGALSREMTAAYVRENEQFLRAQGVPVSPGNIYLAHFLGPRGAAQVLKADPSTPVSQIVGQDAVNANKSILSGKTAGQVAAWAGRKMEGGAAAKPAEAPMMPNASGALAAYRQIDTANRANDALIRADLGRTVSDAVSATTHTGRYDGAVPSEADFISAFGGDGSRRFNEFQQAMGVAGDIHAMQTLPLNEIKDMIASSRPSHSGPGFEADQQRHETMAQAAQQVVQARHADPAAAIISQSPALQRAWQATDAEGARAAGRATLDMQAELGVPEEMMRVLPKAHVSEIARQFTDQSQGGQNAAQLMQSLAEQWGDLWPQVFSELASQIPAPALVIGSMDMQEQRRAAEELAEAVKDGAKAYKAVLPNEVTGDLHKLVIETVPEITETLVGLPGGIETAGAVAESVELLALRYASQGDDANRAVKRAYNDIVTRKYAFQDGYRVPKIVDAHPVRIGAEAILSNVGNLDPDIPMSQWNLPEGDTRAAWAESLSAFGRWVTRPDEKGLDLYSPDGAIVTSGGEPITFTWEEIAGFEGLDVMQPRIPDNLDPVSEGYLERLRELDAPFEQQWAD